MKKNISIVVPVYKVEKYLNRCVHSILNQSYKDFQLFLVDDGSPDQSGQYCDEYGLNDSRVIVIHQNNGGLSAARNSGIGLMLQNGNSEWITFIDSDDWIHHDYLNALYVAACDFHSPIVSGGYISTAADEQLSNHSLNIESKLMPTENYWISNRTNATVAWGKLYKKYLFEQLRFPLGKFHEDEYITYKLLFQYPRITVVDAPIYYYFYNDDSISRLNYLKRFPDIIEVFGMHYNYFKNSPYPKAFRLETEKYAEAYANAIYSCKEESCTDSCVLENELREKLKLLLKIHRKDIPFEKRKDIYIAAYPQYKLFIRGFGFLKQRFDHE